MKTLVAMMLLFLVREVSPQAPAGPVSGGSLQGRVVRTDNLEPIVGVTVSVRTATGGGVMTSLLTDASGHYLLRNLPAGPYSVTVQREGYLPGWGTSTTPQISRAMVTDGGTFQIPNILMIPDASISGQVVGANGSPAAGVFVELLRRSYNPIGTAQWQAVRPPVAADDRGEYRIFSLGPGEYYVRTGGSMSSRPGLMSAGSVAEIVPSAYYPGVLAANAAASIEIRPGEKAIASFRIPRTDGYNVTGAVINEIRNVPRFPATSLVLVPHEVGAPLEPRSQVRVVNLGEGSDGKFQLRTVPPGSYTLYATARSTDTSLPPPPLLLARGEFVVGNKDVQNLNIVLRDGVDIHGQLTVIGNPTGISLPRGPGAVGGNTTPTAYINVGLNSVDNSPVAGIPPPIIEGNSFRFRGVPEGRYAFFATIQGGQRKDIYVAEIRSGGKNIFDDGLVVSGQTVDPIEVIIKADGGSIQATAVGQTDLPVQIVLVPDTPHRENPALYKVLSLRSPDSQITFANIAPGSYTLYAWEYPDGSPPLPYMDPQFLAKYKSGGKAVRVMDGLSLINVQVSVSRLTQ